MRVTVFVSFSNKIVSASLRRGEHIHIHTHTYIYIYICIYTVSFLFLGSLRGSYVNVSDIKISFVLFSSFFFFLKNSSVASRGFFPSLFFFFLACCAEEEERKKKKEEKAEEQSLFFFLSHTHSSFFFFCFAQLLSRIYCHLLPFIAIIPSCRGKVWFMFLLIYLLFLLHRCYCFH